MTEMKEARDAAVLAARGLERAEAELQDVEERCGRAFLAALAAALARVAEAAEASFGPEVAAKRAEVEARRETLKEMRARAQRLEDEVVDEERRVITFTFSPEQLRTARALEHGLALMHARAEAIRAARSIEAAGLAADPLERDHRHQLAAWRAREAQVLAAAAADGFDEAEVIEVARRARRAPHDRQQEQS
jgi:hypothetical protein